MTKEEFKEKWEADERGSGITYDDIADRAKEWGLYKDPKCYRIEDVTYSVLKAAGCKDADDYRINNQKPISITREERQALYDREFNELMQKPKEDLVRMLIGYKPIW